MDRVNTKRAILDASLELFSVQGYEATSTSQIANAVGIRKASLYSHFESKQAILDELVSDVLERYESQSIFARAEWEPPETLNSRQDITPDEVVKLIQKQIRYIHDTPYINKARKMLVIEQFQNEKLARLHTKQNYTDVMRYFTALIKYLIERGILIDDDPEAMAAQFCLPISMWINLCDREPDREEEVMKLVERHIRQFFKCYRPKPE